MLSSVLYSVGEGQTLLETLSFLLGPVAETLAGARERAYMFSGVVRAAVELFSSILQLLLSSRQLVDTDGVWRGGVQRYSCSLSQLGTWRESLKCYTLASSHGYLTYSHSFMSLCCQAVIIR